MCYSDFGNVPLFPSFFTLLASLPGHKVSQELGGLVSTWERRRLGNCSLQSKSWGSWDPFIVFICLVNSFFFLSPIDIKWLKVSVNLSHELIPISHDLGNKYGELVYHSVYFVKPLSSYGKDCADTCFYVCGFFFSVLMWKVCRAATQANDEKVSSFTSIQTLQKPFWWIV